MIYFLSKMKNESLIFWYQNNHRSEDVGKIDILIHIHLYDD